MDKIRVLQLGKEDWKNRYDVPAWVKITYLEVCDTPFEKLWDLVILDRNITKPEFEVLHSATKAYCLYVTDQVKASEETLQLMKCKMANILPLEDVNRFLLEDAKNFFPKPYGEKKNQTELGIAQGFSGTIKWNGNYDVELNGAYGEELQQIAFWRYNMPIQKGQCLDIWFEYEKEPGVELRLIVRGFPMGSVSALQHKWEYDEEQLRDIIQIENSETPEMLFFSLLAKGEGSLHIRGLHDRISRRGFGNFLPGGERMVSSDREEVFCYFDPGDLKPPLNVYFSGYKTQEGFEGYNLMRGMGCPFLLISEARLEGGAFYMGTEEYEHMIIQAIRKYMKMLHFDETQVVFSGLSMGTYGALYYGCDIAPHALLLGKPLASIGDVAANERLDRPGGFPTSLDVLMCHGGGTDEQAVARLNSKFWEKFDGADWSKTKFIISYMIEDDYDMTAYNKLISHLNSDGVQVFGKGIHGRHNDDTNAIVKWFSSQYQNLLAGDFKREMKE
ncbi:MAG: accessory Sec system protein Asp2 [Agathobacter sp.]